jgi:hypothetical protein
MSDMAHVYEAQSFGTWLRYMIMLIHVEACFGTSLMISYGT